MPLIQQISRARRRTEDIMKKTYANMDDFVSFGDVARDQIGEQCQYISRYVNGQPGRPNLGEGLRIAGDPFDYHFLKIHKDDVAEFVDRVKQHRTNMGITS
jgi:hypothetical protein